MPEFIVEIGHQVERMQVEGTNVLIGRDASCDIVLADESVSREHARIEKKDGRWVLQDLGSANGTFFDDAKVRRISLERGSSFGIAGFARLTFLGAEGDEAELRVAEEGDATGSAEKSAAQESAAGQVAEAAVGPRPPAPELPDYEIVDHLASGPECEIWLAKHGPSETVEVLRVPRRGKDALVEGAAASWSRVDHPAVARLDSLRDGEGNLVLRERFAKLGTLDAKLERDGRMEIDAAIELGRHLARGLEALHRNGVRLGVLRPSRIRLYDDGEPRIAGPGSPKIDASGWREQQIGELNWVAPEHLREESPEEHPRAVSDVYSLGAILYKIITGSDPVEGRSLEKIRKSAEKGPYKPPSEKRYSLPEGLSDLIMSCLAQEPDERPADAATVETALAACAENLAAKPKPQARKVQARERAIGERAEEGPPRSTKHKVISWTITIVLGILLNVGLYLIYKRWF